MKIELTIPQSLNDITVEQYQRFVAFETDEEDVLQWALLDIFCGLPRADAMKLPQYELDAIQGELYKVFAEKPKRVDIFELHGILYGMIPNLEEVTGGEFFDLDTYIQMKDENNFDVANAHKAMAVMYRPLTHRAANMYEIEAYESSAKYSDRMKEAPLSALLGMYAFFLNLKHDLFNASKAYLQALQAEVEQVSDSPSVSGGVGMVRYTTSLVEILQRLTASHPNRYSPFSRL